MFTAGLVLFYIIIPVTHAVLFITALPFAGIGDIINYSISMLAFYSIFNHLLITAKIPVMQTLFPYDKVVKLHAYTGIIILVGICYHVLFKIFIGKHINLISWTLLAFIAVLFFLSILWIETPLTRRLRAFLLHNAWLNRIVSYEIMKKIHKVLFLLLGVLLYLHVIDAGMLEMPIPVISIYATILPFIAMGTVLYSLIRKSRLPKMRLIGKRVISDIAVLTFSVEKQKGWSYKAGQFGYLQWRAAGITREEHPFSYLSAPADEKIMLGIKKSGDFTRDLMNMSLGAEAKLNGGFGNFIPDYSRENVVMIGSGIGIVPIISLLRDMLSNPPPSEVLCFLAVNTREELLFEEDLHRITNELPDVHVYYLIYQQDGALFTESLFRESIKNPEKRSYYICSSHNVRTIVLSELGKLNVSRKQCHFEAFSY